MTVHFIGAGPGAPDLITIRGLNYIRESQVCLYAGSLVPKEVVEEAPIDAEIIDTAIIIEIVFILISTINLPPIISPKININVNGKNL